MALLLVLLAALQYELWATPGGLLDAWHLKRATSDLTIKNGQLQHANAMLAADIQNLKQNTNAIEELARTNLGMVKNGETFYEVIKSATK